MADIQKVCVLLSAAVSATALAVCAEDALAMIANPIARRHFEILMKKAIGEK